MIKTFPSEFNTMEVTEEHVVLNTLWDLEEDSCQQSEYCQNFDWDYEHGGLAADLVVTITEEVLNQADNCSDCYAYQETSAQLD